MTEAPQEPEEPKETPKPEQPIQEGPRVSRAFKLFIGTFWELVKRITNIRTGTDYKGTAEQINKDTYFGGHNIWILICSIFIASIGLNVNSTAVVIGAMLISPLMGPIMGVGFSLATFDWGLLVKAVRNLTITVVISVVTSAIYFLITPLGEPQSELISRTHPTTLDVLVAIFGGVAGVVAGSRNERGNVIPGVAIATALMPPLCTAGYGLATLNMKFFVGAFYLFLINAVFIALSTYVFVRILRFPLKDFVDPSVEKRTRAYTIAILIVFLVPSGITLYKTVRQNFFEINARKFIAQEINEATLYKSHIVFDTDSLPTIELFIMGDVIPKKEEVLLQKKLGNYKLGKAVLVIHQADNSAERFAEIAKETGLQMKSQVLEELYVNNAKQIEDKNKKIAELQYELLRIKRDTIPFVGVTKEIRAQYDGVEKVRFSKAIEVSNAGKLDTVPTVAITWKNDMEQEHIQQSQEKMQKWLRVRLKDPELVVVNY